MTLAAWVREYPDELTCDYAAEYGIWDWRSLPARTAAALAVGLSDTSRVKRRAAGVKLTRTEQLLAAILDGVTELNWRLSRDGQKGRRRPKSVLAELERRESKAAVRGFATAAEFEAARAAGETKVKTHG